MATIKQAQSKQDNERSRITYISGLSYRLRRLTGRAPEQLSSSSGGVGRGGVRTEGSDPGHTH